jgi:hypothetical protein
MPYYKLYEMLNLRSSNKCATSSSPYTTVTEHIVNEETRILTLLNHTPRKERVKVTLTGGFKFARIINVHGITEVTALDDGFELEAQPNTGVVAVIEK